MINKGSVDRGSEGEKGMERREGGRRKWER